MKRNPSALAEQTFDIVIIGGGITGAGVALDAASRGWRVALIDKGDFASGTSSASSKLVHGGLRYLEYGQLGLVHEALQERKLLLTNAPHLVKPLPFLLPFYRGQRLPPWKWRLGLTLYDLLAGRGNIARSRCCNLAYLQSHYGSLLKRDLLGGSIYFDALMDDVRVCLAVLQTAASHGATLANYVEAIGFESLHGSVAGVWARDRSLAGELVRREPALLGEQARRLTPFLIRGRVILNAAGPWSDGVSRLAGDTGAQHLQPTKGVHIIAPDRGHPTAYLLLHPHDQRVFFVIPWLGKTLIGTTDTFPDADAESLAVSPGEIAYLLEAYNHYFDPGLRNEDVMGSFAGLRPILRQTPGEPSSLSREFRLIASPSGLVTVVGGKYTTYRHMAETIVDFLGERLGSLRRCRTKTLPLEGTPNEPWSQFAARALAEMQRQFPIAPDSALHLLHRYGNRVFEVLAMMDGFKRVHPDEPDLFGEQAYQRAEEMAMLSSDLYLRRSRIGMYRAGLT